MQEERPAKLPHGRCLADFEDLSAAEKRLVECCAAGEVWEPEDWDGTRPDEDARNDANTIRAGLIRFLALGGDTRNPVHEAGVAVHGAWIDGMLDLHQCTAPAQLQLENCHFDREPGFIAATIPQLSLSGSRVPGLTADGLHVNGDVFLISGFEARGEVRLLGAKIGGDLSCRGGQFHNEDAKALNADRLDVTGSVFLNADFEAHGEVRLLGAKIGGDLECGEGKFCNKDRDAFLAQSLCLTGALVLRDTTVDGAIILTAAKIGTLVDDPVCWNGGSHFLDGFGYDRIIGTMDSDHRIAWLRSQHASELDGAGFSPQPWEQLAKVLREMGHSGEAADIAMAKQDQMRRAGRIGQRKVHDGYNGLRRTIDAGWAWTSNRLARGWHWVYGKLSGYGYRPQRIVYFMVAATLLCAIAYGLGARAGLIGPSNALVNLHSELDHCGPGKFNWTSADCAVPPEYSTFQPVAYSLDLIIPLVDLHQEADWGPIVVDDNGRTLGWGQAIRLLVWIEILFGWFASLMFVAIVTRLVDRD